MSAKDKNGVELKVGDRVCSPNMTYLITGIQFDGLVKLDHDDWLCPSRAYVKYVPARTYTEAEMGECFEAGGYRNEYEADGCDAEYFAPDFQGFLKNLKAPKPC